MKRILITGATGNIGKEVIHYLCKLDKASEIIAAVRNIERSKNQFSKYSNLSYGIFDFEDSTTFHSAFKNIDILFLLRPPHISEIKKYFQPLLQSAKENNINEPLWTQSP